jgi:regulatory protein
MTTDTVSLKARALRLLGSREYSRAELQNKLARFEVEPGHLAVVLDDLQAKGLMSEQRALESVLHNLSGKMGTARIRQELQRKGLSFDAVSDALKTLQSTELERARVVWEKKFKKPAADAKETAKQVRFLAARGFSGDAIRRVVAGFESEI